MLIKFRTFNCGIGDCLFLILQKEGKSFNIMVDCGRLTDEVLSYVINDLNKTINLLIVTHIDNDHICGVASLLQKVPDLEINKIIFNCYHRDKGDEIKSLTQEQRSILLNLKKCCPVNTEILDGKVSAKEAVSLTEQILNNPKWLDAWNVKPVVAGNVIDLPDGYGSIKVLSPLAKDLDKLEQQFKKEFWAKFYECYSIPISDDEVIFEILLRIWEKNLMKKEAINVSYSRLTKDSFAHHVKKEKILPISLSNLCSLAIIYEFEDIGILLMGDADPGIVMNSMIEIFHTPLPVKLDIIKVSHHGSSHNTTIEFATKVKSLHYYFTGGDRVDRPSLESVSRILATLNEEDEVCTLHFNRINQFVKDLYEYSIQENCKFSVDLKNAMYEIEV